MTLTIDSPLEERKNAFLEHERRCMYPASTYKEHGMDLLFSIKASEYGEEVDFTYEDLDVIERELASDFIYVASPKEKILEHRFRVGLSIIRAQESKIKREYPQFNLLSDSDGAIIFVETPETYKAIHRPSWLQNSVYACGATLHYPELIWKGYAPYRLGNKEYRWYLKYMFLNEGYILSLDWNDKEGLENAVNLLHNSEEIEMILALKSPDEAADIIKFEKPRRIVREILDFIGRESSEKTSYTRELEALILGRRYLFDYEENVSEPFKELYTITEIPIDLGPCPGSSSGIKILVGTRIRLRKSPGWEKIWKDIKDKVENGTLKAVDQNPLTFVEEGTVVGEDGELFIQALIPYHSDFYANPELKEFCFPDKNMDFKYSDPGTFAYGFTGYSHTRRTDDWKHEPMNMTRASSY